jgi:hypothetical protein
MKANALVHLVRSFEEWTVTIGDWSVPKSVSWVALVVAGSLAPVSDNLRRIAECEAGYVCL